MPLKKSNIHRKILESGIEQQIAFELIQDMAVAYNQRQRTPYYDKFKVLISLFTHNFLQEAQLQIMHASNNKEAIREILSCKEKANISDIMIIKLLENHKIKDILSRLASEELSNTEAIFKIRTQLQKIVFADFEQVA